MTPKPLVGWLPLPLADELDADGLRRYSPRGIYRRALYNRANPRSRDYMERLLADRFPEAQLWGEDPPRGSEVVLLYPDAIGLGHGHLERRLPSGTIVLNGRRRELVLNGSTRRALRMRRALERSLVVEVAALIALVVATPFLLAYDLLRGRT